MYVHYRVNLPFEAVNQLVGWLVIEVEHLYSALSKV